MNQQNETNKPIPEPSRSYKSNGKLLITGEYVVLDGAVALAVPTRYGQSLNTYSIESPLIQWTSFDNSNNIWLQAKFNLNDIDVKAIDKISINTPQSRLLHILSTAKSLNPKFLSDNFGYGIKTYLDFPNKWGLGTSSTLINNIAQWANVDPFKLLELTFGGSGYDIACAQYNTAITYQILNNEILADNTLSPDIPNEDRSVTPVEFNPDFKHQLYFVYLNKKQNSRDGIAHYKTLKGDIKPVILEINSITDRILKCKDLNEFKILIEKHESIISKLTQQETAKSIFFNDFDGAIKSLGAWGGDFVLVASEYNPAAYFKSKGFDTVVPYSNMVLT
ncbi:GYDIA family GHMP kinase [Flavobacteriaceae bacterium MHTCC 0001]